MQNLFFSKICNFTNVIYYMKMPSSLEAVGCKTTIVSSSFFFFFFDFQESIAYLPLIMLISATVSSIFSKKLVGIIGNKVR